MGEELYELPKGWVWTSIKEISEVITGTTPSKSNAEYYGRDFPFFKPTDLNKGYYVREAQDCLSKEGIQKARLIPEKSILVTCIGATISKTGFIRVKGSCNQQINAIVPNINLLPEFVYFWCISPFFKKTVIAHASSTTLPILNKSKFETLSFPCPPLSEQYRIVAKIEEIFTELDAGVELLKKLKAKLKRYRQAVLKSAVEGNLTKEWREANQGNLEPASILLERILKQRREKWEAEQLAKMKAQGKPPKDDSWKLKYKEPIAPDTSDLPELPDGWCWASLEQLSDAARSITYGVVKLGEHTENGVATLRSSNVRPLKLDLNGIKKIYSELSNQYGRTILKGGEILITIRGTLGGVVSVPNNCVGYNISREVGMIAPSSEISSYCYSILIASINIQNWLLTRTKGIAYTGINLETLNQTPLPLFSLLEQELIVLEVQKYLSIIDQLEKTIDANLKRSEKLRQSILKQAFEGKLVPQDPNDEPAEKLLERIKAEKAKQTTTKTKRKTQSKKQSDLQLEIPLK